MSNINFVINKYIQKAKRGFSLFKNFKFSAEDYWEERYVRGGNSGAGSYGRLADYKAEIINDFVVKENISTVIEFGCGDGNQLTLFKFNNYIGLDVSKKSIELCINRFTSDRTKSFFLYNSNYFKDNHQIFNADLALSLDVIFHIIDDTLFHLYMTQLFNASNKFVVIYSANEIKNNDLNNPHLKLRKFSDWVDINKPDWKLINTIKNKFPLTNNENNESFSDFYFYERLQ